MSMPTSPPTRRIGTNNVTAIGWGAMELSSVNGPPVSDEARLKLIDAVYEHGCTNWDSADCWGDSEDLLGRWFQRTGKRGEIFLATKCGFVFDGRSPPICGDADYVKGQIEKSLRRLGVDYIDLYYLHRPDPAVPIEITIGAMAEYVKAGKIRYLGISECSLDTLRRAHATHPMAALQVEYSPFALDVENEKIGLFKVAKELGIAVVANWPLGRGTITGQYKSPDDFEPTNFRRTTPKDFEENFPHILKIAEGLKHIGERKNATAGQISLAWLLAQGDNIIPILGTTVIKSLEENLGALKVNLTAKEMEEVRAVAENAVATAGSRHSEGSAGLSFEDTPPLQVWRFASRLLCLTLETW